MSCEGNHWELPLLLRVCDGIRAFLQDYGGVLSEPIDRQTMSRSTAAVCHGETCGLSSMLHIPSLVLRCGNAACRHLQITLVEIAIRRNTQTPIVLQLMRTSVPMPQLRAIVGVALLESDRGAEASEAETSLIICRHAGVEGDYSRRMTRAVTDVGLAPPD